MFSITGGLRGWVKRARENLEFWILKRPISLLTAVIAAVLILVPILLWQPGNPYLAAFDYVDLTTISLVGLLLLNGVWRLRSDTDLQAVSISLVGAISFLYAYEAIFKLSFYFYPSRMPPAELREFTLQAAIALTGLTGFAFNKFRFSRWSWIWLAVFVVGMGFWYAIGFPQLIDQHLVYRPFLALQLDWKLLYWLNRATKIALCFFYFSLFRNGKTLNGS